MSVREDFFRTAFAKSSSEQTNATATVTFAPANANLSAYITGLIVTYSGAVAAATTVTLGDGTTTLTFEIPAGVAGAPTLPFVVPIPYPGARFAKGATVTATLGAGGTGIKGTVTISGYEAP